MRSGRIGHTDIEIATISRHRSGVARFPPATCDSLPCHRPDPARSGRWRVRAPVASMLVGSPIEHLSPTWTTRGCATTSTCASRRGAWASSGRRGIFVGGGPPVGRRAAGVAVPRRGRSSSPSPRGPLRRRRRRRCTRCPSREIEQLTGVHFHRGVLAAADRPDAARPSTSWRRGARRLLVLEAVNDHENIGALFRNAAAFGVDGVVLDPTAADPLYRRATRVSLGHVLRVPFARADAWPDGARPSSAAPGFTARGAQPRRRRAARRPRRRPARRGSPSCSAPRGPGSAPPPLAAVDRQRPHPDGPRGRLGERRHRGGHRPGRAVRADHRLNRPN